MAFFSWDPDDRWALLACDACDRVLVPAGGLTDRTLRESLPEDVAPHFRARDELRTIAVRAAWRESSTGARTSWTCPSCRTIRG